MLVAMPWRPSEQGEREEWVVQECAFSLTRDTGASVAGVLYISGLEENRLSMGLGLLSFPGGLWPSDSVDWTCRMTLHASTSLCLVSCVR